MDIHLIEKALKKPGKSKSGLAEAMGRQPPAVTSLLAGERLLKAHEIPLVAEYLELYTVKIMGRVGAGAAIDPEFEQVPPDGLSTVTLPFPIIDEMVAFEVEGESMLPRYDHGDVIVVWREQRRPLESFYGEEAAVRTKDGKRYLKKILPGKSRSVVTLASFSGAKSIENVRLEWIGEIYITVRASQIRRLRTRAAKKTKGEAA